LESSKRGKKAENLVKKKEIVRLSHIRKGIRKKKLQRKIDFSTLLFFFYSSLNHTHPFGRTHGFGSIISLAQLTRLDILTKKLKEKRKGRNSSFQHLFDVDIIPLRNLKLNRVKKNIEFVTGE
jgi:hypothetical protein